MLTDHDKQASGNREPAYENCSCEVNKVDPMQDIPVWLQPFTVNLEDLEAHVIVHSPEKDNSDSEGDASKVETQKNGSTVFIRTSANTERDLFHDQKSLMT